MELVEIIPDETNSNNDTNAEEKIFSRTFTLDGIPATLPYAWITKVFDICSQVQMWYNPLDKDEAITRMVRFKNIIYDDAKSNRATSELFKRADAASSISRSFVFDGISSFSRVMGMSAFLIFIFRTSLT